MEICINTQNAETQMSESLNNYRPLREHTRKFPPFLISLSLFLHPPHKMKRGVAANAYNGPATKRPRKVLSRKRPRDRPPIVLDKDHYSHAEVIELIGQMEHQYMVRLDAHLRHLREQLRTHPPTYIS